MRSGRLTFSLGYDKLYPMSNTEQLLATVDTALEQMTMQQAREWMNKHEGLAVGRLTSKGLEVTPEAVWDEMERMERRLHATAVGAHTMPGVDAEHAGRLLAMVSAAKMLVSMP